MCGYPLALQMAPVVPLAAPIPQVPWAQGRAVYRSDLIVRSNSPYQRLEDTFGGRAGWTVSHSQSGFNAFRHELMAYRTPQRPALYAHMADNLITARNILDGVREGRLDVGPLDAYWHLLIARHAPELTAGIRVLSSTPLTPMPPFVIAAGAPPEMAQRLRESFTHAQRQAWFAEFAEPLALAGFEPASTAAFAPLLEWDREAVAAGFGVPA
jgi:ABC-type phosphate/phosphonate transport system substrate-binding protein